MALRSGLRKLASRVADQALGRGARPPAPQRAEPRPSPPPRPAGPGPGASAEPDPALPARLQDLYRRAVAALRQVHDPELPLNIFDLGLVYAIEVHADGRARVAMTLTSPSCPEGPAILAEATRVLRETEGVVYPRVDLVWDPPWDPAHLPLEARIGLGIG